MSVFRFRSTSFSPTSRLVPERVLLPGRDSELLDDLVLLVEVYLDLLAHVKDGAVAARAKDLLVQGFLLQNKKYQETRTKKNNSKFQF